MLAEMTTPVKYFFERSRRLCLLAALTRAAKQLSPALRAAFSAWCQWRPFLRRGVRSQGSALARPVRVALIGASAGAGIIQTGKDGRCGFPAGDKHAGGSDKRVKSGVE